PHGVAQYDFEASHDDEISFKEGEVIILTGRMENEWLKGKIGHKEGIFPANFIEIIHPLHSEVYNGRPDSSPSPRSGPRCRARFDFEGEGQGDLVFEEGDVIKLLKHVGTDWLQGELDNKTGIFPLSFVEIIEDVPVESQQDPDEQNLATTVFDFEVLYRCTALYDYDSAQIEDLCFNAGDTIEVLQDQGEWLKGRLHTRFGIFPKSFVEIDAAGKRIFKPIFKRKTEEQLAKALFDFNGENDKELTFKKDDIIKLGELVDGASDWQWGNLHGNHGIFPVNFITLL
ncbi:hypothetical protein LOTGIDRAFT_125183, partial [Lottia gigantea]